MKNICRLGVGIGVLSLAAMLSVAGDSKRSQAETLKTSGGAVGIDVEATVKSKTKIQIKWKTKKKVSQIRIFRTNKKNWESVTLKKIATLSGKKKSYTDKVTFNKNYAYKICAYQKKGKKYKKVGSTSCWQFTGVAPVAWDEYSFCDAVTTPKEIPLEGSVDGLGMKPDGFQIYRGTDKKNLKKIKTIKKKQFWFRYKDKTVKSHETYYYKVRAFKTIGKKKYYGAFSNIERHSAINHEGKYQVKVVTKEGDAIPSLITCLTSDSGNGDLVFEGGCCGTLDTDSLGVMSIWATQYSYDGEKWYSLENKRVVLKAGQSIYLKWEEADGKPFRFNTEGECAEIEGCNVKYDYDGLSYLFSIDFKKLVARVCVDGEMYH